jgi:ribosomal protein S18 acetylase RimI-like enzyme
MFSIIKAGHQDMERLRDLAIRTFTEAYSEYNSPEDMQAYFEKSFSKEGISRELNDPLTEFHICYDNEFPVGYTRLNYDSICEALPDLHAAELQRIYVSKDHYRRKAGKTMLDHVLEICEMKGFKAIWLGVWKENRRAINFYFNQGFKIAGERNFKLGSKIYEDYYLVKYFD